MELHKAEKRWVRPQEVDGKMTGDDKETMDLYRKFQGILNKLTPTKFQKLAEQALELAINSQERLQVCIDKIFTKVHCSRTIAHGGLEIVNYRPFHI